jgi:AraC family transcriptional activator FtrA
MRCDVKIVPNTAGRPLIVVLAYDGLCTFEFGVAVEVFGLPRPEMGDDWYDFAVCGVDEGPMRATGGVRVLADGGMELLQRAHTIIIPGWRGCDAPVSDELAEAIRAADGRGARLVSICSGILVLAAAGVLKGRRATTHWRYIPAFQARFPDITLEEDVLYVDEGQVLTSAGSAAGIDLCLHLVRRDFGAEAANRVARRMVVPPHRDGGQAQFVELPVPKEREGARLSPLLDRMRQRLSEPQPIPALAKEAGMSVRTFLRRFKAATGMAPGEWLLNERLAHARALLEGSRATLDDVAAAVGFGSTATLRHHFRERLGVSPAAYRARFGGALVSGAASA